MKNYDKYLKLLILFFREKCISDIEISKLTILTSLGIDIVKLTELERYLETLDIVSNASEMAELITFGDIAGYLINEN